MDYEADSSFAREGHLLDQQAGPDQEVEFSEPVGTAGLDRWPAEGGLRHLQIRREPPPHRQVNCVAIMQQFACLLDLFDLPRVSTVGRRQEIRPAHLRARDQLPTLEGLPVRARVCQVG